MHDSRTGTPSRPLLFGEVLFDHLPDGQKVLGGAPFNVAWHLQGLGLRPLLVSRVGDDAAGEQVLTSMQAWGMDTAGIQRDSVLPTGAVEVRVEGGQPAFHILPDQAYDRIDADAALASTAGDPHLLLYHGTLAARGEQSRRALEALRREATPVFIDVNLRAPWWNGARVGRLLHGARWLKLSREELDRLAGDPGAKSVAARAEALRSRYGLELLLLTEGGAGARVFTPFGQGSQAAMPAKPLVDTVGAGDAFAAVCILALARGWPLTETLARAAELAAHICARPGATHREPGLYQALLERWSA